MFTTIWNILQLVYLLTCAIKKKKIQIIVDLCDVDVCERL